MKFLILIFAIISVTSAVTFNCTFIMEEFYRLPSTYACYNPTISNIDESETVTAVYGNHMSGKSNDDVGLVNIYNNDLTFFPRGLETFFPNLTAIAIAGSKIENLYGNELDAFNNLTWFAFENNPLERVPGGLFFNTPLIKTVFLDLNNIKHVGENLMDSLTHLEYANFQFNYCVNQYAQTASQIPSLIEHLRNNCTDIETTSTSTTILSTTTTEILTTPSTEVPSCGDMNEIICHLEEQNEILMEQNQILMQKNVEMDAKIDDLNEKMKEVLEGILELSTRPCGV